MFSNMLLQSIDCMIKLWYTEKNGKWGAAMEFWIFLLGVIAFFAAWPYLRCLVKRVILAGKLRRVCRKKSLTLHPAHSLWFLGGKGAGRCDCYIETPTEVYAVKLFGMPRRPTVLLFRENGDYIIRSLFALMSFVTFTFHTKPKAMPVYDFRYRYHEEWEIKTPRRVLLVHPVSMEIRRQPDRSGEVILGAGDTVCGMEIQTLPRLLGALERTP